MTEKEARAAAILRGYGDRAYYEEMVDTMARGQADVMEAGELGVLLRHRRAGLYMLAGDPARMTDMAMRLPHDGGAIVLHGAIGIQKVRAIREAFGYGRAVPYVNYAYYGELPPEADGADIRRLDETHVDFLYANYGHADRAYLAGRVADGAMIGAYVDGALAGFIGEHIEGSMGLLHIMPAYRRHHLGFTLERANIRRTMLRGHTPFCQVAVDNAASRSLQRRLGMEEAGSLSYWITNDSM